MNAKTTAAWKRAPAADRPMGAMATPHAARIRNQRVRRQRARSLVSGFELGPNFTRRLRASSAVNPVASAASFPGRVGGILQSMSQRFSGGIWGIAPKRWPNGLLGSDFRINLAAGAGGSHGRDTPYSCPYALRCSVTAVMEHSGHRMECS